MNDDVDSLLFSKKLKDKVFLSILPTKLFLLVVATDWSPSNLSLSVELDPIFEVGKILSKFIVWAKKSKLSIQEVFIISCILPTLTLTPLNAPLFNDINKSNKLRLFYFIITYILLIFNA